MNNDFMKTGAILCLVAMVSFSMWPFWQWMNAKAVDQALHNRTKDLVAKHPELKPAWNIAMHDGVLNWPEAKEIIEGAGEKIDSDK